MLSTNSRTERRGKKKGKIVQIPPKILVMFSMSQLLTILTEE